MNNDLGLFPPASTGRYTARKGSDPWTDLDRMLLYPILAACGTEHAYYDTCLWLCEFLGRAPVFPDTKRPTTAEKHAAAAKLIEHSTVTVGLSTKGSLEGLASRLFFGTRTGKDLTWGELRLVRSWCQKKIAAPGSKGEWAGVIPAPVFLFYLDRGTTDLGNLEQVCQLVKNGTAMSVHEDRDRHPAEASRELRLGRTVKLVREAPDNKLPVAWENLLHVLSV